MFSPSAHLRSSQQNGGSKGLHIRPGAELGFARVLKTGVVDAQWLLDFEAR